VASVAETTAVGYIAEATIVSVTGASVRPAAKPTSVDSGEPTEAVSADGNTSEGSHASSECKCCYKLQTEQSQA
jgi:hypothetical protein